MRTILGLVAVVTAVSITGASSIEVLNEQPLNTSSVWFLAKNRTNVTIKSDTLRLLLVGDIGGVPWPPYYTDAQLQVAEIMEAWAKRIGGLHGVLNVGDNIYFTGVNEVTSWRFNTTFEDVYNGPGLDVTWYMIAGNHDHFGTVEAQVQYTRYSRKWLFPALYYKLSFTFGKNNTAVDVVFIDTVELCGNTADFERGHFIDLLTHPQHEPMYPKNPNLAKLQWDWINRTLNSSTADYLFVAGHYPVFSVATHGPTQCLLDHLKPRLEAYNVSAYFAGHDHSIQHFNTTMKNGHEIHYVLSGAASRADYSGKHLTDERIPLNSYRIRYPHTHVWWPLSQLGIDTIGGFVQMNITSEAANLTFVTGNDREIYKFTIKPRKKKSTQGSAPSKRLGMFWFFHEVEGDS
ncbi:unnamed protein product [Cylicocyclus nassatus]|uniref:Tartrate-resistant acid phosphatase type 5 n=1 Tax=Cylicocyclus nassatus TaxID=53992 RepID=A0AA36DVF9_CYLNA|nr:unnamed protein product [Cylicocyclus nassatus]